MIYSKVIQVFQTYLDLERQIQWPTFVCVASLGLISTVSGSPSCIRDQQSVHRTTASPEFVFSLSASGL